VARGSEGLGNLLAAEMPAGKSWYKTDDSDIAVYRDQDGQQQTEPLSRYSSVVRNIGRNDQVLLYCVPENRSKAATKVKEILDGME
jgi:hypothetical protein